MPLPRPHLRIGLWHPHSANLVETAHGITSAGSMASVGVRIFDIAHSILASVKLMHMLKAGQLVIEERNEDLAPAEPVYALAA